MPYVDPHAFTPYDYRTDPTQRTNPEGFWVGYGRFREGVNYDALPEGRDRMAGWCYGMTEGKAAPKPLWQSKTFYHGLAVIGLALWGGANVDAIANNPEAVAGIAAVLGVLEIMIRAITRGPIKCPKPISAAYTTAWTRYLGSCRP